MTMSTKLRQLLQLLETGTKRKQLQWDPTPSPDVFRVDLPVGFARIVRTSPLVENEGERVHSVLTLLDEKGITLDEWDSQKDAEASAELQELFETARESALNLEKRVDEVLFQLQRLVGS